MQAAKATHPTEFEFIVGNRPQDLRADTSRKLRSYLSKRAWKAHRDAYERSRRESDSPSSNPSSSNQDSPESQTSNSSAAGNGKVPKTKTPVVKNTRRRKNKLHTVTFECVSTAPAQPPLALPWGTIQNVTGIDDPNKVPQADLLHLLAQSVGRSLPMDTQFGGGRVDPFRSYPGPWRPWIPALADHCEHTLPSLCYSTACKPTMVIHHVT